jgi:hypothetical protein
VKSALLKQTRSGILTIKAVLSGKSNQFFIVPLNPTIGYAVTFTLGGPFNAYCSGTGTATPDPNDAKTFKVRNDTVPPPPPSFCGILCSPSGAFVDEG